MKSASVRAGVGGRRGGGGTHPQVSPSVVLSVLDHYVRRNEDQERVIGTLLGVVNEAGEIEVRGSFPVPHSEKDDTVRPAFFVLPPPPHALHVHAPARRRCATATANAPLPVAPRRRLAFCPPRSQVLVNMEFHKTMFVLQRRVSPKDSIVGWCGHATQSARHGVGDGRD